LSGSNVDADFIAEIFECGGNADQIPENFIIKRLRFRCCGCFYFVRIALFAPLEIIFVRNVCVG